MVPIELLSRPDVLAVVIFAVIMVNVIYYFIDRRTIIRETGSNGWLFTSVTLIPYFVKIRHYKVTFQNDQGKWFRKYCIVNSYGVDWREEG